jgi:hypothetical protein
LFENSFQFHHFIFELSLFIFELTQFNFKLPRFIFEVEFSGFKWFAPGFGYQSAVFNSPF